MPLTSFPVLLLRSPLNSLRYAYSNVDDGKQGFREGVYLASPALWQALRKKDLLLQKERLSLGRSLSKYWIRSCMRSTPYGTFAGVATVQLTDGPTRILRLDDTAHARHIRVDMAYLARIIDALAGLPHIRSQLKFYPNNSLYEIPGGYRYAEFMQRKEVRSYRLASIAAHKYTKAVIDTARNGATIADLSCLLQNSEDVTSAEAEAFIGDLLRAQVLMSQLEICLTGSNPLDGLIAQLNPLEGVHDLVRLLKNVSCRAQTPAEAIAHFEAIETQLESLNVALDKPVNALQVDLFLKTAQSQVNKDLISAVVQQAEDLLLLAKPIANKDLDVFKSRFVEKYADAEVSLSLALDPDLGVGYSGSSDIDAGSSELVDGLDVIADAGNRKELAADSNIGRFVVSKYIQCLKAGDDAIVITEEDLSEFRKQSGGCRFPASMYLMGNLLMEDSRLDKDHFQFNVTGMHGPSAANILGRFAYGDDEVFSLVKEIIEKEEEEYPDAIYAEIVHLPQARLGNILLRPLLRNYEIPYLGISGAPDERQIPIDDLMISVQHGEVRLRSRKHNKRVLPRLTTAHNFSHGSLPVYKLLCDLQFQGLAYANAWDWGALSGLEHLPRVTYKNLILQKARWDISEKAIKDLPHEATAYPAYFKTLCARLRLPQRVVLADADNELLINFAEAQGMDLFLHYLRRYKKIRLEEFLFTEDNCVVTDAAGNPFANELVIPLCRTIAPIRESLMQPNAELVQRKFLPGSEWLYFKVYCGNKTAEKFLLDTLLPFVEDGSKTGLFARFFFIRYRDDWGHLRIRFYNLDLAKQAPLQTLFMEQLQPLISSGVIDKVILDTYDREIERYGSDLMEETEALFCNDSLAILRCLSLLDDSGAEEHRMLLALRGVDMLLNDFDLSQEQKQRLLKSLQHDFFRECGASAILQKQLNEQYRRYQADIFLHLDPANDRDWEFGEAAVLFSYRSEMNKPIICSMRNKLQQPDEARIIKLLSSFLHMFMNRFFAAQQRKYELVAYHFLEKYYSSCLAKDKKAAMRHSIDLHPSIV